MRRSPRNTARHAAALVGSLALAQLAVAACGDSSATSPSGRGTLAVQLTDAPFPFGSVRSVDMFVVRIDAKTADADSANTAADVNSDTKVGDSNDGWVTIATPNQSYNLLDLQQGKTVNLGAASLPLGTYRAFRLVLNTDQSSITLTDGSHPSIKFPSAGRSGIKVQLADPVTVGGAGSTIVLDFDLAHSFVLRGNDIHNNGLLFKPVIRATARDISGSITGTVVADSAKGAVVPNALVELLKAGSAVDDTASADVVASGKTDSTGHYHIAFIRPDTYVVRATSPDTAYARALLSGGATIAASTDFAASAIVVTKKPAAP